MRRAEPAGPRGSSLRELARSHGVELRHQDGLDREVEPSDEVLRAILKDMGVPLTVPERAPELLRARRREVASRAFEPVSVAWTDQPLVLDSGPALDAGRRVEFEILEEPSHDGSPGEEPKPLRVGSATSTPEGLPLPGSLPPGYYHVRVRFGGHAARTLLVVAPPRAYGAGAGNPDPPSPVGDREWGVFLPLYALRSIRDWGTGDLTDLGRLLRWTEERGGHAVGTLPLLAAFLDPPVESSPYSPASRLFWNELYLDPTRLPEWHLCPEARQLAASDPFRRLIHEARTNELVDHRKVYELLSALLQPLARAWSRAGGERSREFNRFLAEYPDARTYAAFRATRERRGENWDEWPNAWRGSGIPEDAYTRDSYLRHLYGQFRFQGQMRDLVSGRSPGGAGLYLDLPLGVHPAGYDVWKHQELFAHRSSLGAPPDGFHADGQSWGLPPVRPEAARERGHSLFRNVLRRILPQARYLRIDHIMGLHRLYWVPHGAEAADGAYVRYPARELYAILCLESHRHETVLVGEDLGTVPGEVRREMDSRGLRRTYVVPFELADDPEEGLMPVPGGALATLNTHDLPTFSTALSDRELYGRLERMAASPENGPGTEAPTDGAGPVPILRNVLEWLGRSPAGLVMVNLEDLWLEERSQNTPGTTSPENWRRKARLSLEEFSAHPQVTACLRSLALARSSAPEPGRPDPGAGSPAGRAGPQGEPPMQSHDATPQTSSIAPDGTRDEPDESESDPRISRQDLYLFNEGTHTRLYRKLGAHLSTDPARPGVHFAVWAPSASGVSVIGDFNDWNADLHPMEVLEESGIWERFVPDVGKGARYKFHIVPAGGGDPLEKADPFGFRHETPPATASVVWDLAYDWEDQDWMAKRADRNHHEAPISVYEVHLGSWRRDPEHPGRLRGYGELAPELASYAKELGFSHVELLPITEHPFYGSWGYQTTGYFAPTSRYGSPQDFMSLVDHLHQEEIGVILDWVPSHFPSDAHGLARFDGTHLFEHADPQQGFHPDWESLIFNYGRHEVRSFLLSSALFWLDQYHVDGVRVDAVASMLYLDYSRKEGEWIPNRFGGRENLEAIDFLRRLNEEVYGAYPDVQTFAEESTAWPMVSRPTYVGGLGFGMKWDMGWMHDTLKFLSRDPVHRKHHHDEITFRAIYAFNENFMLPLSHDEVVHGKGSLIDRMPGDEWQKRANLRILLAYQFLQPGKKLLFMGGELAQWSEWNHEGELDWELLENPAHAGIQRLVSDLNRLYREEPALHTSDFRPEGFEWAESGDREHGVLAFLRKSIGDEPAPPVMALVNLVPVPRENYRVGVPTEGHWSEALNTDADVYGGSGRGNLGGVETDPVPSHGHYHSVVLSLPPLAVVVLKAPER